MLTAYALHVKDSEKGMNELAASLRTGIFGQLDADCLQYLIDRASRRHYPKGTVLYHQGDAQDAVHLILQGEARAYISMPNGKEMLMMLFNPGDLLFEIGVLHGLPSPAAIRAIKPVETLMIPRKAVLDLMMMNSLVGTGIAQMLAMRFGQTAVRRATSPVKPVESRMAEIVLSLADKPGSTIAVNQSMLASRVGASRQHVNSIVASWRRRGLVETRPRFIVRDELGLRELLMG